MALTPRSWRVALDTDVMASGRASFRSVVRIRRWLPARWRQLVTDRTLPAEVRAQLRFHGGERVLSIGRAPGGRRILVATDQALHYRSGEHGWSRRGWEQVARAEWDAAVSGLVITSLTSAGPPRTVLPLRDRGALPELAQERITHTKLGCWRMLFASGYRVVVEARRRPVTGELMWVLTSYDGRLDLGDDNVRTEVRRAMARLGGDVGLTHRFDPDLLMSLARGHLLEGG